MSEAPTITNLEAANRQLCTAIRLFFADDDAVAVHTLACAAREIYEKQCRAAGRGRIFDFVQAGKSRPRRARPVELAERSAQFFQTPGSIAR